MKDSKDVLKENGRKIASRLVEAKQNAARNVWVNDEASMSNVAQSKIITLDLTNGTNSKKKFFFGTPLSSKFEAPAIKAIWDQIDDDIKWSNKTQSNGSDGLPLIEDNNGANAEFYQEINKRFIRRPVLVDSITVVTTSETQRSVSPKKVNVPANIGDASEMSMEFNGVYTEFNEVQLIFEPIALGEFTGISYQIGAGVQCKMNFHLAAIDSTVFKY